MMLAAIVALAVAPVQDRAISVAQFIKSFDTEEIKYTASKQMGKHIVFVHAPDQPSDAIKAKLADALSASWRKTETGFRLERTQAQSQELERTEVEKRATVFRQYQATLESRLSSNQTAVDRTNSALKNLIAIQERFRTTRPGSFQQETELPADWLLFSILAEHDAKEVASMPLRSHISFSSRPVGGQRALPPGSAELLENYLRDRRELSDFADTIVSSVGDGPLTSWIKERIDGLRETKPIERVIINVGRSSITFFAGLHVYDDEGEFVDHSMVWTSTTPSGKQLEIPSSLTASLNDVEQIFVGTTFGYSFIRNPHPEAIDKIIGKEPLCSMEPIFAKLAEHVTRPVVVVLDDNLLEAADRGTGSIKNVAGFIQRAMDMGSLSVLENGDWLLLRPLYLKDCEAVSYDRSAIDPFLESTKRAGYVTIEGHVSVTAAAPMDYLFMLSPIFAYLDRNGYVLANEKHPFSPASSRVLQEMLRFRGGVPREAVEISVASLSSKARSELLYWARMGVATLEARPDQESSSLERNGYYALPNGLRADAIIRLTPTVSGAVGLREPFPSAFSAEQLGRLCASSRKAPAELMSGPYWFGERRGLRMEILLTPKTMLSNEYYESASEMKEMRAYESLPEAFRKEVEKSYEERRKTLSGG